MMNLLLPYLVFEVQDEQRVLIARFATQTFAEDFIEYMATVYDSRLEWQREH